MSPAEWANVNIKSMIDILKAEFELYLKDQSNSQKLIDRVTSSIISPVSGGLDKLLVSACIQYIVFSKMLGLAIKYFKNHSNLISLVFKTYYVNGLNRMHLYSNLFI